MKHIPLTKGCYALVDDANYLWHSQLRWCYSSDGYAVNDYRDERVCGQRADPVFPLPVFAPHRRTMLPSVPANRSGVYVDHSPHWLQRLFHRNARRQGDRCDLFDGSGILNASLHSVRERVGQTGDDAGGKRRRSASDFTQGGVDAVG
jgi:hypothetical protein